MAAPSSADNQACLVWRNAVPVTWQQRVAEHIVKREQFENNLVQKEIEAAEQSLARLKLAAKLQRAEDGEEQYEVSDIISQESASTVEAVWGRNVSFSNANHPENRDPVRPGTPFVLLINTNGYLTDDEGEAPHVSRSETRNSASYNMSPPSLTPNPELLHSPVPSLRSLNPSEVWDDEMPVGPILYAPVPLRPLIKPELLLVGYEEPRPESTIERISALLDELKSLHDDVDSLLRQRRALSKDA